MALSCLFLLGSCCGIGGFPLRGHEPKELDEEEIPEWLKADKKPEMDKPAEVEKPISPPVAEVDDDEATTEAGPDEVKGSLPKDEIRATIKEDINKIRFCYESKLVKQPTLEGKVTVKFVISPKGSVQKSEVTSSTLDNPEVEQCILAVVDQFEFPEPEGGGVVVVSYPFVFKTAD